MRKRRVWQGIVAVVVALATLSVAKGNESADEETESGPASSTRRLTTTIGVIGGEEGIGGWEGRLIFGTTGSWSFGITAAAERIAATQELVLCNDRRETFETSAGGEIAGRLAYRAIDGDDLQLGILASVGGYMTHASPPAGSPDPGCETWLLQTLLAVGITLERPLDARTSLVVEIDGVVLRATGLTSYHGRARAGVAFAL